MLTVVHAVMMPPGENRLTSPHGCGLDIVVVGQRYPAGQVVCPALPAGQKYPAEHGRDRKPVDAEGQK